MLINDDFQETLDQGGMAVGQSTVIQFDHSYQASAMSAPMRYQNQHQFPTSQPTYAQLIPMHRLNPSNPLEGSGQDIPNPNPFQRPMQTLDEEDGEEEEDDEYSEVSDAGYQPQLVNKQPQKAAPPMGPAMRIQRPSPAYQPQTGRLSRRQVSLDTPPNKYPRLDQPNPGIRTSQRQYPTADPLEAPNPQPTGSRTHPNPTRPGSVVQPVGTRRHRLVIPPGLTPEEEAEFRLKYKRANNREAAAASRKRKTDCIESKTQEVEELKQTIQEMQAQRDQLLREMKDMQMKLDIHQLAGCKIPGMKKK